MLSKTLSAALTILLLSSALCGLALAADTPEYISVRDQIVAAYQKAYEALRHDDAETAVKMDTDDWTSHVVGQPMRTRKELAPYVLAEKPPTSWNVVWLPDYEHNGTISGIQLYDLKVDGKAATILCLVGSTHEEQIDGATHRVWHGSHVRDSWTQTSAGWKRRKHEKLTINERMIDGKPAK
jgi:hypothetical protein